MMTEIDILRRADKLIRDALRLELNRQGHTLTGKLERSIHGTVLSRGDTTTLTGTMLYYGHILNRGVSANRIPFRGSGGGNAGGKRSGTSPG